MENNWKIKNKNEIGEIMKNIDREIFSRHHPVVLEVLASRGYDDAQKIRKYFDFDYDRDIHNPFLFCDMKKALDRLVLAKEKGEKIAIFGDYDADGVSASVLLLETLANLGFKDVEYYIPDRELEGYGMNEKAIGELAEKKVTLIITVDCGIANGQEIEICREKGIDVIITDHHHVPQKLPQTVAIINPHWQDCGYPFADLAGVGVAFKLAQALYLTFDPKNIDQLKWSLDLVALGTIADSVPLGGENRVLVKYGLVVLSKTRRVGLEELYQVGRLDITSEKIPSTHQVAFQIAPRINAAGRMDHANMALALLLERDRARGRSIALDLENKNQERQKISKEMYREVKIIADSMWKKKNMIFAENIHWPVGLLGLVAGKIADEYQKPTLIMKKKENELVGSWRSIEAIDIMEALELAQEHLIRFGGHRQAAGIRIALEQVEPYLAKMEEYISRKLAGAEKDCILEIDALLATDRIDWQLMEDLERMEPFGKGNEEPIFAVYDLEVVESRIVGNGSKHLKLAVKSNSDVPKIFDVIGFGLGEKYAGVKSGDRLDLAFNLKKDEWNSTQKIQMKIVDIKHHSV